MSKEKFDLAIQIALRRLALIRWMRWGTWGVIGTLAMAILLLVAARFWMIPYYRTIVWWIVGTGMIGSLGVMMPIVKRKERMKEALQTLDRISGDQIGTALTYMMDSSPFALKQREEAMRFVDTKMRDSLRENVPLPSVRKQAIPFVVCGMIFAFLMFSNNPLDELRLRQLAEAEWLMLRTEQIEQLIERSSLDEVKDERLLALLQDLEKQLRDASTVEHTLQRMDHTMTQLGRMVHSLTTEEKRFALEVAQQLEAMGTAQNEAELALQNGVNVRLNHPSLLALAERSTQTATAAQIDAEQSLNDLEGQTNSDRANADDRGSESLGDQERSTTSDASTGAGAENSEGSSSSGGMLTNENGSSRNNEGDMTGENGQVASAEAGYGAGDEAGDGAGGEVSDGAGDEAGDGASGGIEGGAEGGNGRSGIAGGSGHGSRSLVSTPFDLESEPTIEIDGGPLLGSGSDIEYGGDAVVRQYRPHDYEAVYGEYRTEAQQVIEQNHWPLTMREQVQAYFEQINPDDTRP